MGYLQNIRKDKRNFQTRKKSGLRKIRTDK